MKCIYCGEEIQKWDTFCPHCGKSLIFSNDEMAVEDQEEDLQEGDPEESNPEDMNPMDPVDPDNEKPLADKALNRKRITVLIIIVILIAAFAAAITFPLLHQDLPEKTISLRTIDGVNSSEVIDEVGVLFLKAHDEKTLTFQVEPKEKTDTLRYTSSDESIVTIEKTGKYTAKVRGVLSENDRDRNTTITVSLYDKNDDKISSETIDVRVVSERKYPKNL